jgi:hypothetical protein
VGWHPDIAGATNKADDNVIFKYRSPTEEKAIVRKQFGMTAGNS